MISGIHTGSGKTLVSAMLSAALGANYWKPVQSGLEEETDSEYVGRVGGLPAEKILPEAWRLPWPASPHASAEREGVTITPESLQIPASSETLVIEGAGGLMVPLNREFLFVDLFAQWQWPVVLVADTYLGSINHTLLSAEALKTRNIPVKGIIFNDKGRPESEEVILSFSGFPCLGRVPHIEKPSRSALIEVFENNFSRSDWEF